MKHELHILEQLTQLREENEHLRQAAESFGELAERLMQQLLAERRHRAKMHIETRSATAKRRLAQSVG